MPSYRTPRILSFGVIKLFTLLCLIFYVASLSAQTLEIVLLNGRNGRPIVGSSSHVNVWVGTKRKEAIVVPTDGKGVVRLQLTLNASEVNIPTAPNNGSIIVDHPIATYDESLRINTPYVSCESDGSNHSWLRSGSFSMKDMLQRGYVSSNTCGKATALPQPGRMVLFVRPLTWWENLKQ